MRIIGTALCAVALGAFGTAASAATISFGETFSPVAIADASTASRTIDVTTVGTIVDLDVVVDFSQSGDWINSDGSISGTGYPFPEELSLTLQSAQGTSVTLIGTGSYSNGSAGRYVFTFDDEAASGYASATASGTYRPSGFLSAFDAEEMMGLWTITIGDSAGADPKSLNAVSLNFTYEVVAVPLPAGAPLLVGGLAVLGLRRRRRM